MPRARWRFPASTSRPRPASTGRFWRPTGTIRNSGWTTSAAIRPRWTRPTRRRPVRPAVIFTGTTCRRRRCLRVASVGTGRMPTTMRRSTSWPVGRAAGPGPGPLHGKGRSRQGPQRSVNTMCRHCGMPIATGRSLSAGLCPGTHRARCRRSWPHSARPARCRRLPGPTSTNVKQCPMRRQSGQVVQIPIQ